MTFFFFFDCIPLLMVNHDGRSHGLLLSSICRCCHCNLIIQISIHSFILTAAVYVIAVQTWFLVLFCAVHGLSLFESYFGERKKKALPGHQLRYSPSGCTMKEWQFSTWLFEWLICCGSASVTSGSTGTAILMCSCSTDWMNVCHYVYTWAFVWALIISW